MRKQDIVDEIYQQTGLPKKDIQLVVNLFLDSVRNALLREERIELRGFGVFDVKQRKGRVGRNPKTKEIIHIPPRKVISFKPSKLVKELKEDE
ncbi:MAG TPA: HU family DNA-binding protein [Candidatus Hydrothermia bacterium]|nr:integration host factor subunit beta [Candidatus Hydrothermae bacterium]MDD3648535.1 integration host factor subunit beta [Candidatus Hydrothermia bacterium]MDD5572724.1 integration host factor subunit beta [Candidatus Hydrothermia bacterium]HOK22605.1 HU family DNA-binding protein [Candidatus Hydrothermia bacterium]HOL23312.1 HU family DNA-binding protein [Candidatus Hydrothermia bacterium]